MSVPRSVPTKFSEQLRVQLERHASIKSVRRLGRELNPERPEIGRRMLSKWISGTRPTLASRVLVANALGVDPAVFADEDDDSEADSEVADLVTLLMQSINRKVDERLELRLRSLSESGASDHGTDAAPGSESEVLA